MLHGAEPVSKAYWKLYEVLSRMKLMDSISPLSNCLDVGAAPGGWTQCIVGAMLNNLNSDDEKVTREHDSIELSPTMASDLIRGRIWAVDKGRLTIDPLPKCVTIVPKMLEDALPIIADQLRQTVSKKLQFLLCDANLTPAQSMVIVGKVADAGCLGAGTIVVLTLKNFCKSDGHWERECALVKEILGEALCSGDSDRFGRPILMHLFNNGMTEITLVLRCRTPTSRGNDPMITQDFKTERIKSCAEELSEKEKKRMLNGDTEKRIRKTREYEERQKKKAI